MKAIAQKWKEMPPVLHLIILVQIIIVIFAVALDIAGDPILPHKQAVQILKDSTLNANMRLPKSYIELTDAYNGCIASSYADFSLVAICDKEKDKFVPLLEL